MSNTRIQKLKQKNFEFSNPHDKKFWCEVQFDIMWLIDIHKNKYFKITTSIVYPHKVASHAKHLKECLKAHPMHATISNKELTSYDLSQFIEMMEQTVTVKHTTAFESIIQNLIQLRAGSPDTCKHVIELYKMLSTQNC